MRMRRGPVSSMNAVRTSAVSPPEVIPLLSSCCRKVGQPVGGNLAALAADADPEREADDRGLAVVHPVLQHDPGTEP